MKSSIDHDLMKAAAGWMQCADILEAVTESFEFAMSELRANKFEWSDEKKIAFMKADSRLRLAKQYIEARDPGRLVPHHGSGPDNQ